MIRSLLLFVSALVLTACPAMASTYYVGTCHAKSFPTIMAAVNAVPAGSIIDVCPGNYAEQVIISKSLTLQGISFQNKDAVGICCVVGGVAETQVLGLSLIPAIWVTAGTVNIFNFTSSISTDSPGCGQLPTGIFYASGSSGTMNHVYVDAGGNRCGAGIVAENETANSTSITIENSFIYTDNFGIIMGSQQAKGATPVLLNTITGNSIAGPILHGMLLLQSRGKVSANTINVSGQDSSAYGIEQVAPATAITDNSIYSSETGIFIDAAGSTVTGNKIVALASGIDLGCTLGTVTGNTIFAAGTGLNHVPNSFTGKNTLLHANSLISGGC